MPGRIFKDSMCRSDDMAKLSWFEQVVFTRLIVTADDFGRLDGRIPVIRCAIFPLDLERVSLDDLESAIYNIFDKGMIYCYSVNNKPYIYIPTWDKYQKRRAKESKFPAPFDDDAEKEDNSSVQFPEEQDVNILLQDENICGQMQTNVPDNREPINDNREPRNGKPPAPKFASEIKAIVSAWNQSGFTEVKSVSSRSTRYKMLCAMLSDNGLESVLEAIKRASRSNFLKGQNNTGWVITFDWFVKPSNFQKVIEGNYDNRNHTPRASPGQESTIDRLGRLYQESGE